jgi:aspartyl-tRNA(Asn)/glutamyl-tRNA(Gln) amidotransferase subunit C
MSIDKKSVDYVAHLARIELEPKELEKLSGQLKGILDFIDKLKQVDVTHTPATSHILPINNILRDDSRAESLSCGQALENAPQKERNFFVVPKVIEG